ncbi:hypothetical protein EFR00_25055 [Rhizobium sophoriradicis]|uniref:hypothetical protein n=1 Tax=Rhizobium TaxID=379 RepID=UPI0004D6E874|nr:MULTISPECIES: hypothetical protein [Rhizobium]ARQ59214.1 hypothetical protein Kim5_CH03183 [Rhizobium sp. Kim5]KEC73933.1 hypothetical protein RLPCCGM1_c2052 [Rhizobium leguminosarum bv. phaseoli CCGM1]RSB91795.1 hypothetical protein EFR00_25055 [Rhizobium sophoriradicis]
MSAALMLSTEITNARTRFDGLVSPDRLKDADVVAFRKHLQILGKLAQSLEREVQIYRLCEAGKTGREVVEQLAAEAAATFVLSRDDNVIRPDFGRKA